MKQNKKQIFMLYLACGYKKIYFNNSVFPKVNTVCGILIDSVFEVEIQLDLENKPPFNRMTQSIEYCKLILRPFSDMTEEEKQYIKTHYTIHSYKNNPDVIDSFQVYLYLLLIGIDLFGAIESGYAINEKELLWQ